MSAIEIIFAAAIFIFNIVMLCIINKIIDNKEYISELEDRHWQECAQIAKYEYENRRLKKLLRDIRSHYGVNYRKILPSFRRLDEEKGTIHEKRCKYGIVVRDLHNKPPDSKS